MEYTLNVRITCVARFVDKAKLYVKGQKFLLSSNLSWMSSKYYYVHNTIPSFFSVGQPPMGALLARRNSINYAAETTMHQLVKRDMNIFCSQELTDTQN